MFTTTFILSLFFALNLAHGGFEACSNDRATFCASSTERHEIHSCMRSHWESLSPECRDVIERHEQEHDHSEGHHHEGHEENENKPHTPCQACEKDKEALCPTASTFEELRQCFGSNWKSLSEECRASLEQQMHDHEGHLKDVFITCESDRQALCADAKDMMETRVCMRQHWDSLSSDCRNAITQFHEQHQDPKQPKHEDEHDGVACPRKMCSQDIESLCSGTEGESLNACLKENWNSLSQQCQTAIIEYVKAVSQHQTEDGDVVEGNSGSGVSVETVSNNPCSKDFALYCPKTSLYSPKDVQKCVESHLHDLSGECQLAILNEYSSRHPVVVTHHTRPDHWTVWVMRYWWTYPVGLVLLVQVLACIRIRQIRRAEAGYLPL